MAEYICKDDIIKMLKEKEPLPFIENNFLVGVIEAFPTADVQPIVHGEWKLMFTEDENVWKCSVCGEAWLLNEGTPYDNNMKYCCRCGAKMDREAENG